MIIAWRGGKLNNFIIYVRMDIKLCLFIWYTYDGVFTFLYILICDEVDLKENLCYVKCCYDNHTCEELFVVFYNSCMIYVCGWCYIYVDDHVRVRSGLYDLMRWIL